MSAAKRRGRLLWEQHVRKIHLLWAAMSGTQQVSWSRARGKRPRSVAERARLNRKSLNPKIMSPHVTVMNPNYESIKKTIDPFWKPIVSLFHNSILQ